MGGGVRQDGRALLRAYEEIDSDNSGGVSYEELIDALGPKNLDVGLTHAEMLELCKALDKDGNGDITYSEFLEQLMFADKPETERIIDRGRRVNMKFLTTASKRPIQAEPPTVARPQTTSVAERLAAQSLVAERRALDARRPMCIDTQSPFKPIMDAADDNISHSPIASVRSASVEASVRSIRTANGSRPQNVASQHQAGTFYAQPLRHSTSPVNATLDSQWSIAPVQVAASGLDRNFLHSRSGGKSFASSPKLQQNDATWSRVGLGGGIKTVSGLYLDETSRRKDLHGGGVAVKKGYDEDALRRSPLARTGYERTRGFSNRNIRRARMGVYEDRVNYRRQRQQYRKDVGEELRLRAKTQQRERYMAHCEKLEIANKRKRKLGQGRGGMKSPQAAFHRRGSMYVNGFSLS
eukprot:g958.t1